MFGIKMSQLMAMKKSFIHYSEYENGETTEKNKENRKSGGENKLKYS